MTKTYALLGDPVAHSLSPSFQNAALQAACLEGTYVTTRVRGAESLRPHAEALRTGALRGANITLPYKAEALGLADVGTPLATQLGVANTWYPDAEGRVVAANTDVAGFAATLQAFRVGTGRALVLGAGGASLAVLAGLVKRCHDLSVVNRSLVRASGVVALGCAWRPVGSLPIHAMAWERCATERAFAQADLVVDATSLAHLGRESAEEAYGALPFERLSPTATVLSLSYGPGLASLRARVPEGCRVLDGLTMLLHQGALSFQLWHGVAPCLETMREALAEAAGQPVTGIGLWPGVFDHTS